MFNSHKVELSMEGIVLIVYSIDSIPFTFFIGNVMLSTEGLQNSIPKETFACLCSLQHCSQ